MLDKEKTNIIIYTTSWCGPCKSAKRFLSDHGFDFKEIDIEKENISREEMASMTKGTQVPQIVINSDPIGGFEDLLEYFRQN
ncbi:MAG: glutaredoxin [Candidatus Neomarinimicrobiota bacterium]|nr:glutaredoxin [Candidatus Neomarinimicrobiota bacterium]